MAEQATLYDLVLLLSSDAPDEQRTRILSAVESAISKGGGSVERNDDWGRRPMAYEIKHRPEAEYHLLQFHAPPTVIEELSHNLRITDGVLRSRIIKVRPGTPDVKPGAPPVVAAVASAGSATSAAGDGGRSGSGRAPTQEAEEPEPAPAPSVDDEASAAEEAPVETEAPASDASGDAPSPE